MVQDGLKNGAVNLSLIGFEGCDATCVEDVHKMPERPFTFELLQQEGLARAGLFHTPHGVVPTPIFMPVGTHATVKTLTMHQLADTGSQMILNNAYHLYLRPGHALIAKAGGLHRWSNWSRPILTDSGGFQVFSLAKHRKIEPDGVRFKDPLTGDTHFLGPKTSMEIQRALGADVIMAFDECPPYPIDHAKAKVSLDITHRWLEQCFQVFEATPPVHDYPQALFPIVQGSTFLDLREQSAREVQQYPAHGFAVGGVSVGEPREEMHRIIEHTVPLLPVNKPRYLMGVGTVEDILAGIRSGVDLFDCVMPSRVARHGAFYTRRGRMMIKTQPFESDFGPLEEGCPCYACQHHHRAYIRHLYRIDETTAKTLLTIHNIMFLVRLTQDAREAIMANRFSDFCGETLAQFGEGAKS